MSQTCNETVWIGAAELRPRYLSSASHSGLYLAVDVDCTLIWLVGDPHRGLIYLDRFEFSALSEELNYAAVFVGEVRMAADPLAFSYQDQGQPGQLRYDSGKIYLLGAPSRRGGMARRLEIADLPGNENGLSYPIFCSHWALLADDIDGETKVIFEADVRPPA